MLATDVSILGIVQVPYPLAMQSAQLGKNRLQQGFAKFDSHFFRMGHRIQDKIIKPFQLLKIIKIQFNTSVNIKNISIYFDILIINVEQFLYEIAINLSAICTTIIDNTRRGIILIVGLKFVISIIPPVIPHPGQGIPKI